MSKKQSAVVNHSQYILWLLARRETGQLALGALAVGSRRDLGAAAAALVDALVLLADPLGGTARVVDGGGVAVVGVDADEVRGQAAGADAIEDDVAGASVVGAVAAAAVELTGIDNGEVADGNGASTVVLDDLVGSVLSTTALNEDVACAKSRDGVLTNIAEPDVGQGASTTAVDTLELASTDDDVGDAGAVLEDKDSRGAASVSVGVAVTTTVKLLVSEVTGTRDNGRLGEGDDAARTGGNVEGLSRNQAAGGEQGDDGGLHLGAGVVGSEKIAMICLWARVS